MKFGGKAVVANTIERMGEIGIASPLVLTNPEHASAYDHALRGYSAEVKPYVGNPMSFAVLASAFHQLKGEDILLVADDNVFDFSLEEMAKKFERVNDNVLAVKALDEIPDWEQLNLGTCNVAGDKITYATFSFSPVKQEPVNLGILDLYMIHHKRIVDFGKMLSDPVKAINEWWHDFYAWKPTGFWADICKPVLRKEAERYFSNH